MSSPEGKLAVQRSNPESYDHYVPKLLLRSFVASDGKINLLNIRTEVRSRRPISQVAGETGFFHFEFPGGGKRTAESHLQRIESDAARVIKRIVRDRSVAFLVDIDKKKLSKFIVAQSFRTKAFFAGLNGSDSESRAMVWSLLWRSLDRQVDMLLSRDFILLQALSGSTFLIGDHPVTLQVAESPDQGGQVGFDVKGVEGFMPIASDLALWLPPEELIAEIVDGYQSASTIHQAMHSHSVSKEGSVAEESELQLVARRAVASAFPIYFAKSSGSPLMLTSENMENFNSLQILFSSTEVFSADGNFDFALRVLSESPGFSRTVKTQIYFSFPLEGEE